ncbi:hypothetical protein KXD40_005819 [Peronospora effusa]|nr:hypothetical protein KXD40_005819 [Peronospora effusa]
MICTRTGTLLTVTASVGSADAKSEYTKLSSATRILRIVTQHISEVRVSRLDSLRGSLLVGLFRKQGSYQEDIAESNVYDSKLELPIVSEFDSAKVISGIPFFVTWHRSKVSLRSSSGVIYNTPRTET